MTFTIHGPPEEEDEEEKFDVEESEGEEIVVQNSVSITATVYQVEENETMPNCPIKVFIHFKRTEGGAGNANLFGQTLREIMGYIWDGNKKEVEEG